MDETSAEDLQSTPAPELSQGLSYAYDKPDERQKQVS